VTIDVTDPATFAGLDEPDPWRRGLAPTIRLPLPNAFGEAEIESPEWWLRRLHTELVARQPYLALHDAYYRGNQPAPWLPRQAQQEFRRVLDLVGANICGLIPDATAERLALEGFRLPGQEGADEETWRIWKANNLDEDFDLAILEALIGGTAYTCVQPNGTDTPDVYIEHASQAIVAYEPGSNRRRKAAGLKVWVDDWTGKLCATLDVQAGGGQWLFKFRCDIPAGEQVVDPGSVQWERREVPGEEWPARNPLDEVALTEIPNNPRLLTGGRSELEDIVPIQDRINKTIADRLMTQDFGAFPALFASGYPDDGSDEPVQIGRDRMVTTDVAETKWWQMSPAPLDPYSASKREDIRDAASRSRTPAQYLLGDLSNVNGETLKASESGLVAKCRQRMRPIGGGAVNTMRLARKAAGLPVPDERMESLWRNPEFRTEGETTDAAVKQVQAGLRDVRSAREFVGMSQTEIAQIEDRENTMDPVAQQVARSFQALTAGGGSGPAAAGG
jgi:hypothetical protein